VKEVEEEGGGGKGKREGKKAGRKKRKRERKKKKRPNLLSRSGSAGLAQQSVGSWHQRQISYR